MAGLDKVVYLGNRRFLPEDHELRTQCSGFPDNEADNRPAPQQVSNTDIKWNSVAHVRAKNATQAANIAKATGSKVSIIFQICQQYLHVLLHSYCLKKMCNVQNCTIFNFSNKMMILLL